jgi:Zn-dependent peptidase ImmA (M78 family)
MNNGAPDGGRQAFKAAFRLRVKSGYALDRPCDVYDLISQVGITLQFIDVPSLEGMYLEEPDVTRICVCSRRPSGRQKYTAAHELGHRVLGHGTQLDPSLELRENGTASPVEERLADMFAQSVLMPPSAVNQGFRLRGYDPGAPRPDQVYVVSAWLGVGFTTLVRQMRLTLGLVSRSQYKSLLGTDVKKLRGAIIGQSTNNELWPLDAYWAGSNVHTQLGDFVTGAESENTEGLLEPVDSTPGQKVYTTRRVGECLVTLQGSGKVRLRVSRRAFAGFYEFRYLEGCD